MVRSTLQQLSSSFLDEQAALFMSNWQLYLEEVRTMAVGTAIEKFTEAGEVSGGIAAGIDFIIALLRNAEKAGMCLLFSAKDTLRFMPIEFGNEQVKAFRVDTFAYTEIARKSIDDCFAFKLVIDAIYHWLPNDDGDRFTDDFRIGTLVGIELLLRFEGKYAQIPA